MKRTRRIHFYPIVLLLLSALLSTHPGWSQAFRIPEKKEEKKPAAKITQPDTAKHAAVAPPEQSMPQINNIKVLSETEDGKGNFIRTIQYTKGSMRITETVIKPKAAYAPLGLYVTIKPDTMDKKQVQLVVDKTNYTLKVLYRKKPIRVYRATFGPQPKQNKCMEGDRCTPEGNFTITSLNPRSMYNKFMLLSYPDENSWTRFNQLKKDGKIPNSAKIGGSVGIHGIWKGGDQLIELGVGWTDGCVALKNRDVDELYTFVGVGTKVTIK
ncbi:MAG TPA: L,D-transpeptidase [Flavipsychrobacter sp.]|nr:L,D-transpeptidase [Flavipsychrobacter sp.]